LLKPLCDIFSDDDDFVISDEDLDVRALSSEEDSNPHLGRGRRNDDSDFVMDEYESGSDWESSRKPQKTKVSVQKYHCMYQLSSVPK